MLLSLKLLVIAGLLGITAPVAAQSIFHRKTEWTVPEVSKWAQDEKTSAWHGWLLYQGSDSLSHHFISRVMDEWAFFTVKRAELKLPDERLYRRPSSSAPLGYYYVDATRQFVKVKDY